MTQIQLPVLVLAAVAAALNVPVTAFFRRYEEQRDCSYVRRGEGLVIERVGTRAGHEYRLLGHNIQSRVNVEPYLITLTDESISPSRVVEAIAVPAATIADCSMNSLRVKFAPSRDCRLFVDMISTFRGKKQGR